MALARVVTFEGVDQDRMAQVKQQIEGGDRPDELPATEIIVLHDPQNDKSVTIVFFDSEDDYKKGHEFLDAMPGDNTPGRRASVEKYDVTVRASG